ncbi:hypothetical protein GPZ77_34425 (plasmid) [Streptomyces sp. QHH-9511]|uniref:hypothetical protein n=1 Tax=Streptomyces sp. QHH-9511 TaxID=2684468 RepID=UPI0013182844|nr:hypothetical protein [Streptomyces sp. QHH-9511]QGZ53328.1 hypothetical protein GPZ77_34425 [Streptomyces sp. QHH-9511]
MSTKTTKQGWDQATYNCGRCGAKRVSTTEAEYIKMYAAHQNAHDVWERLTPVQRDGFIAVLAEIFSAPELCQELLLLAHAESQRSRST